MDTERSGLDEAMDVGSSTVSHLKSLKTAATFSKAGYGAALGGPFTAAIGAVIANRNQLAKILLVILAILLLPVLFIVMLPGLIFGSLTERSMQQFPVFHKVILHPSMIPIHTASPSMPIC